MSATAVEVDPGSQVRSLHEPVAGDANMSGVSGVGADLTVTILAPATGSRKSILIERVDWSYSAAPAGGGLTVGDGSSTFLDIDITAAGRGSVEVNRLITKETNAVITLLGGGGAVVGKVNVTARIGEMVNIPLAPAGSMFVITKGYGGLKVVTKGYGS